MVLMQRESSPSPNLFSSFPRTGLESRHPGMWRENAAVPLRATGICRSPPPPPKTGGALIAHLCRSCPGPTAFLLLTYLPNGYMAAVGQVLTGILFPSQKSLVCCIPPCPSHSRPFMCFQRNAMDRKKRDTLHTSCLCLPHSHSVRLQL